MDNDKNFLDELLDEVEKRERSLLASHIDLVLSELGKLEADIAKNFTQAEDEKKIIDDWTLRKNSKIQDKIDWMSKKLEAYMREQGDSVRTLEFPNGQLLIRKQPNKIIIEDLEKFMLNADASMITVVPETVKPDLRKVMAYYKKRQIPPVGTKLVIGEEKFSIKINRNDKEDQDNGETKIGTDIERGKDYKAVI